MKRATAVAARVVTRVGHKRAWPQIPLASPNFSTTATSAASAADATVSTSKVRVEDVPIIDKAIVATQDFPAGTVLVESFTEAKDVLASPTMHTVCVAPGAHVDVTAPLRYTAHSCAPCGRVEVEEGEGGDWTVRVVATRDVAAGERVTFDYATTEWDMDAPFECSCGAATCRGFVQGAAHLTPAQAAGLFSSASPVVQGQMLEAFGRSVATP